MSELKAKQLVADVFDNPLFEFLVKDLLELFTKYKTSKCYYVSDIRYIRNGPKRDCVIVVASDFKTCQNYYSKNNNNMLSFAKKFNHKNMIELSDNFMPSILNMVAFI